MKRILFISTFLTALLLGIGVPMQTNASSFKSFIILEKINFSKYLISDGFSYFEVSLSYACPTLVRGQFVSIDTFLYPAYGDTVIPPYGNTCSVNDFASQKWLTKYTAIESISTDLAVIQSNTGSKYLIKYGYGCYSSDFYAGDRVYLEGFSGIVRNYSRLRIYSGFSSKSCLITESRMLNFGSSSGEAENEKKKTPSKKAKITYMVVERYQANAPGKDSKKLREEYITYKNNDKNKTITAKKWSIENGKSTGYYLPDFKLKPGETITVITGEGEDELTGKNKKTYLGRKKEFFINKGATAKLFDSKNRIVVEAKK